ncbi:hypothetical protein FOI68_04120 [Brevibacillus sp. LEMMJ03]|uniref:competence protein CoiA n=1 Tax=Brevibacillus sp. LEMMJ03 TaxID=2595056 RepID=UPI0011804190|nr:hypothetical protein FOI68_04120 [Brevibacillus sp. LEMMJ03]
MFGFFREWTTCFLRFFVRPAGGTRVKRGDDHLEKCQHTDGFFVGANEYDESLLRRWSTKSLRCLLCHGPVKYRHGPKIKPHFAHVARAVCEYREPETHEHVCGKEVIKQWVSSLFPANNTTVEACVSNGNQRADVLTVFPDGQQLCIEFQCSPVPLEVLRKRMKGYEENGIAQLWIIGYSRFRGKPLNRFRLHAWEDVIRQRHKQMLCVQSVAVQIDRVSVRRRRRRRSSLSLSRPGIRPVGYRIVPACLYIGDNRLLCRSRRCHAPFAGQAHIL